jgi:hypothetical protein
MASPMVCATAAQEGGNRCSGTNMPSTATSGSLLLKASITSIGSNIYITDATRPRREGRGSAASHAPTVNNHVPDRAAIGHWRGVPRGTGPRGPPATPTPPQWTMWSRGDTTPWRRIDGRSSISRTGPSPRAGPRLRGARHRGDSLVGHALVRTFSTDLTGSGGAKALFFGVT